MLEVDVASDPMHQFERWFVDASAQVRIEGELSRVSTAESDSYFASRPRASQIAARTSFQSQPVQDRRTLETRFSEVSGQFSETDVPRPQWWGGFRLTPRMFEFWEQRPNRLHDRLRYSRAGERRDIDRLQP